MAKVLVISTLVAAFASVALLACGDPNKPPPLTPDSEHVESEHVDAPDAEAPAAPVPTAPAPIN